MQVIARAAAQALRGNTRQVGTMSIEETKKAIKMNDIGIYIGLAICAGFIAYDTMYPEPDFHGVIPHYPYMRMRNKEFPWRGDKGPFEHHSYIEGHTGEHH